MKTKKQKIELKHIIVIVIALFAFSGMGKTALFATADVGDPSAVYCEGINGLVSSVYLRNYSFEVRTDDEGNEYGVCILPDGTECDSWDFFNGKCGQNYTYCELYLGDISTVEAVDQFTQEHAICTLKTGINCTEWELFNGLCPRITCWDIAQVPEATPTASETFVRSNYECVEKNVSRSSHGGTGMRLAENQQCSGFGYSEAIYCLNVLNRSECFEDLHCKEKAKVVCDDGLVEYNSYYCDIRCYITETEPCTDPDRNRENCEGSRGFWDSDEGCRWKYWISTKLLAQETLRERDCLDVGGEWVNGKCGLPTEGSCSSFLSSGLALGPENEGYYGLYSTAEKCNNQWKSEDEETVEPQKIETLTPVPLVETSPPELEPEPVKAPEKKGICGPTVVVLLMMPMLVFRHRRTSS